MTPGRPPRAKAARPGAPAATPELGDVGGIERRMSIALAAIVAGWAVCAWAPSNWWWGWMGLRAWAPAPRLALIAFALSGFVPAVAAPLARVLDRIGERWRRAGWRGDLAVGLLAAVPVALVRDPIRFTGDSLTRLGSLGLPVPIERLFPQIAPLDRWINIEWPRALMAAGMRDETALCWVGAVVALGVALAWSRLLRALECPGRAAVPALLVMAGGATLTHLAGYDKFGPLVLGLLLASLGAIRIANARAGAPSLAAGSIIAVLAHRAGWLVLPASAWVLALAWRSTRGRDRRSVVVAAVALAVTVLAALPPAVRTFATVDWAVHRPGATVARSFETPEATPALVRVTDALNGVSWFVPLWPVALLALFFVRRRAASPARPEAPEHVPPQPRPSGAPSPEPRPSRAPSPGPPPSRAAGWRPLIGPYVLALGATLGVLMLVGATRGSGRDWDAAAGAGTLVGIGAAALLSRAWSSPSARGSRTAAITVTLAMAASLWRGHAVESVALARCETLMHAHPAWSAASRAYANDLLGAHAMNAGRYDEASRRFRAAIGDAPNPRYFQQLGLVELAAGRPAAAAPWFDEVVRRDPGVADPWVGLARVALELGDRDRAALMVDSALTRNPADASARALIREWSLRLPPATTR